MKIKNLLDDSWKKTLKTNVAKLTPEEAKEILTNHKPGIVGPTADKYRELTGGFLSQAISIEISRALGKRAGLIK